MNCASLEVMAADIVWIEEETTHTGIAVFAIWLIVSVAIVAIVALLVRRWQKRPIARLYGILQNPPSAAALDEIHSLIKQLGKQFPQLETVIPQLDELRFAPQPPSDEQLRDFYNKLSDIYQNIL